jgi:hypothetical protein
MRLKKTGKTKQNHTHTVYDERDVRQSKRVDAKPAGSLAVVVKDVEVIHTA